MPDATTFGSWLKSYRKHHDLTQQNLADQIGCAVSTVRKLEADRLQPSKALAEHMTKVLGIGAKQRPTFVRAARAGQSPTATAPTPTRTTPQHATPAPLTSFVGRAAEAQRVSERLADPACRLVTILGPGGIGKTRLALAVAQTPPVRFRDGAAFVALAGVGAADVLAATILQALGVPQSGQFAPEARLLNYLRERPLLLVLDNYEHLLPEIKLLVTILAHAPDVTLLVTSRERLALQAEWLVDLDGLAYPDDDHLDVQEHYDSVELFVQRARQVQPHFALDATTAPAVERICQLAEGLPLAIELAAAAVREHACATIADQLATNAQALAATWRDVPDRHRSVGAAFAHSWALLTPDEQHVFARLSVFRGGFEADAAVAVADATPTILAALADKSLVRCSATDRYDLHELLRQYGAEQLTETATADLCSRHASYFMEFARCAKQTEEIAWFPRLERDHPNLRAALHWAIKQHDAATALSLASDLTWFWIHHGGDLGEAWNWLDRALKIEQDAPLNIRAAALGSAGGIAWRQNAFEQAVPLLRLSLEAFRELKDHKSSAWLALNLARALIELGDTTEFPALIAETTMIFEHLGYSYGLAWTELLEGDIAFKYNQFELSHAKYASSLSRFQQLADPRGIAWAHLNIGSVAVVQGHSANAVHALRTSIHSFCEYGDMLGILIALEGFAALLIQSSAMHGSSKRVQSIVAQLLGRVDVLSASIHARSPRTHGILRVIAMHHMNPLAHVPQITAAWTVGETLSLDEAIAMAINETERIIGNS